ncbi:MAG: PH domain-containing protein [Chthoniobacterales bacterium]
MEFYVYLNGARRGPFREERLQALLDEGALLPTDLAADSAASEWKPISAFRRFTPSAVEKVAESLTIAPGPSEATAVRVPESPPAVAIPIGPYARATLSPNETPCYQTSLHWFVFVRFGLLALALFFFAAIPLAIGIQALTGSELGRLILPLPAVLLLPPTIAFASSEIVITNRRVLLKTGVIRRQTAEVFLSKVESIAVDQGFLGRMFNFGSVRIRGTGGFEETFDGIAKPLLFRNWVQRLQSGEEVASVRSSVI